MRRALLALALAVVLSGCAAPAGEVPGATPSPPATPTPSPASGPTPTAASGGDEDLARIQATLGRALEEVGAAFTAAGDGDYAAARTSVHGGRLLLELAHGDHLRHADDLAPDARRGLGVALDAAASFADSVDAAIPWLEGVSDVVAATEAAVTEEDHAVLAYAMETVSAAGHRAALAFRDAVTGIGYTVRNDPDAASFLGFSGEDLAALEGLVDEFDAAVGETDALLESLRSAAGAAYVPTAQRALPPSGTAGVPAELLSDELVAHFDSFDADGSGTIDVEEARAFYHWVEDHVTYRYDDEEEADPYPGYPVGDGRPGGDHHQMPWETFEERLGDCEDMNALEVAFYNYWGITAYQAYVNAELEDAYDHAIAIVRVADSPQAFADTLGALHYYEFTQDDGWGVEPGVYMIVDNAYSDEMGYLSGGLEPDRFLIYEVFGLGDDPQHAIS